MNADAWRGSPATLPSERTGGKVRSVAGPARLEQPLGPRQILEPVAAEVDEHDVVGVGQRGRGGGRHQHLSRRRGCPDPGGPLGVHPDEAVLVPGGGAGVDAHGDVRLGQGVRRAHGVDRRPERRCGPRAVHPEQGCRLHRRRARRAAPAARTRPTPRAAGWWSGPRTAPGSPRSGVVPSTRVATERSNASASSTYGQCTASNGAGRRRSRGPARAPAPARLGRGCAGPRSRPTPRPPRRGSTPRRPRRPPPALAGSPAGRRLRPPGRGPTRR